MKHTILNLISPDAVVDITSNGFGGPTQPVIPAGSIGIIEQGAFTDPNAHDRCQAMVLPTSAGVWTYDDYMLAVKRWNRYIYDQPEGQQKQPHNRIQHQGQQSQRPAEKQEKAPQQELDHRETYFTKLRRWRPKSSLSGPPQKPIML